MNRLYTLSEQSESDVAPDESNLLFMLSSDKDQRKNSRSLSNCIRR